MTYEKEKSIKKKASIPTTNIDAEKKKIGKKNSKKSTYKYDSIMKS